MAHYMGRIIGPIAGEPEVIPASDYIPKEDDALKQLPYWRRFLILDISIGVGGNILTTMMTCSWHMLCFLQKGYCHNTMNPPLYRADLSTRI